MSRHSAMFFLIIFFLHYSAISHSCDNENGGSGWPNNVCTAKTPLNSFNGYETTSQAILDPTLDESSEPLHQEWNEFIFKMVLALILLCIVGIVICICCKVRRCCDTDSDTDFEDDQGDVNVEDNQEVVHETVYARESDPSLRCIDMLRNQNMDRSSSGIDCETVSSTENDPLLPGNDTLQQQYAQSSTSEIKCETVSSTENDPLLPGNDTLQQQYAQSSTSEINGDRVDSEDLKDPSSYEYVPYITHHLLRQVIRLAIDTKIPYPDGDRVDSEDLKDPSSYEYVPYITHHLLRQVIRLAIDTKIPYPDDHKVDSEISDELLSEITLFVKNEIGEQYIHPPSFGLRKAFEDSDNKIPLIIISSCGSDPMQTLFSFAKKNNKLKKFISFSMENTKNLTAEWIIDDAKKTGMWVCLQNCHLALSWMSKLENLLASSNSSFTSPDFRVWLTMNSCSEFPVSILQNGVKIINEEPDTLKENLLLRYNSEPLCNLHFYESCPGVENIFSRLLYAITFFHGVVCERRKFGLVGWNIPYWFDENDYLTSIFQLQMFVGEYEKSSFEPMLYLMGECNYGGKVIDQWDKRILNVHIKEFINEEIIKFEKYSVIKNNILYYMPVKNDYKDFIDCIKNLPTVSDPDIFGLNSNAGFAYDLKQSGELLEDMCTFFGFCKPNEYKDAILQRKLENILSKIPEFFYINEAMKTYPPSNDDYLTVILVHEMFKLNEILKVINETVSDLLKALKGFSKLTNEMEIISYSLLKNEVPQAWTAVSYPTLNFLGSYLNDFSERKSFLQDWYKSGRLMDYWLSGFCFPKAFLTGIIQNYSHKQNILLDDIELDYDFLKEDRATDFSESGTKVYGIYLDCARWNRAENCLEEEYPMRRFDKLPLLDIKPKLKTSQKSENKYACPLYIRPTREGDISTFGNSRNYITSVLVMCKEHPSHWIKRGAAMTCQIIE